MERWIVKYTSGAEANATSPSQAKNFAHCDKKATIHHLVEAREKVWVVRDSSGDLLQVYCAEDSAWEYVLQSYKDSIALFVTQEWLGGGS